MIEFIKTQEHENKKTSQPKAGPPRAEKQNIKKNIYIYSILFYCFYVLLIYDI